MASDITVSKLRGVLEIVRLANAETDLDTLLALIPQQACALLEADRAALYLLDKAAGELYSAVALGLTDKTIRLKLHQGVSGMVATTGKPILLTDAYADPRFYRGVDETHRVSDAADPVRSHQEPAGRECSASWNSSTSAPAVSRRRMRRF